MKLLSRDQIVYSCDKNSSPVLEVRPGDIIQVETHDARTGSIRTNEDLLDQPSPGGGNPATGPILVAGAEAGCGLAVEILSIDLADQGFLAVKAKTGLLASQADRFVTRIVAIDDGEVVFDDHLRLPVRPMVGVIGTAPAGEGVPTTLPGPHGGNMDNRYIGPGATVYMPVQVPGGLLCLGDVHATMGDGEITMVGLEISATVTIRVDAAADPVSRPWIETPDLWVTTGDDMDPAEALRIAAGEMARLLQRQLKVGFEEAYMLISARGDVQICQICSPGSYPVTTRAVFPRL